MTAPLELPRTAGRRIRIIAAGILAPVLAISGLEPVTTVVPAS